jgi:hypothetical protein
MRAALVLVLTLACMSAAQESYSGLDDDFVDQFNGEGSHTQMTYTEALRKAQRGMADYEVLDVFRSGLEEVKSSYNEQLKNDRKTNLAALLLDLANKEPDPGAWTSMYLEAEQLAKEVLQVFPYDDAARSNAAAARKSLNFRKGQLDRAVPGFMKEDLNPMLLDEDDDDDDLRDQVRIDAYVNVVLLCVCAFSAILCILRPCPAPFHLSRVHSLLRRVHSRPRPRASLHGCNSINRSAATP